MNDCLIASQAALWAEMRARSPPNVDQSRHRVALRSRMQWTNFGT